MRTTQDMSYVDKIVELFGGIRPMAKITGFSPSTVASWKSRGTIPDRHKAHVLSAAVSEKLELEPSDFFPIEPDADGTGSEKAA